MDTNLGSGLREKGEARREIKHINLLKLNREEKDIDSSPNGAEPESRPRTERMGAGQDRAHL